MLGFIMTSFLPRRTTCNYLKNFSAMASWPSSSNPSNHSWLLLYMPMFFRSVSFAIFSTLFLLN
ncbi:hypothetical protein PRUPE_2G063200 [Prunus persica]|uniref:Uncharacterized protein n=1 Tax=Prunus persica TaxID=3760 RepID=A0A251QC23_PRUPE|nr:hypothetical protein PRUPE_2G063200 [Prunus persica]